MHIWNVFARNIRASTRSSLKAGSILVHCKQQFCEKPIAISRTAILDKGIQLRREMEVSDVTVRGIYNLSPSVKGLKLFIPNKEFTFKAGQWVDFLVPNMNEIAGYSICSSPKTLHEKNEIELAVKFSSFPPTKWIHEKCQVDSEVGLVVGGDFYYTAQTASPSRDLLLIAGGVGINPLISILRHVADLKSTQGYCLPRRVLLVYSARSFDELIFKDDICDILASNSEMKAKFFITQHNGISLGGFKGVQSTTNHRLNIESLSSILEKEFDDVKNIDCYVCGPNALIDDVAQILLDLQVPAHQIKHEKWLKELLRTRLIECGWKDQLKVHCKEIVRQRGLENITVDDLVAEITPKGRATVPNQVKKELLQRIRAFISTIS